MVLMTILEAKWKKLPIVITLTRDNTAIFEVAHRDKDIKGILVTKRQIIFPAPETRIVGGGLTWYICFEENVLAVPPRVLYDIIELRDRLDVQNYDDMVRFWSRITELVMRDEKARRGELPKEGNLLSEREKLVYINIARRIRGITEFLVEGFHPLELKALIRKIQMAQPTPPRKGFELKWIVLLGLMALGALILVIALPFILQFIQGFAPKTPPKVMP
jgi:hypothetical protein